MSSSASRKHHFYLYDWRAKQYREVQDGTVCGRTEGEMLFPMDRSVSRRQCQFRVVGNEIYVEELSKTNHTRVNGVAIEIGRKRRLRLDDLIQFGKRRFTLTHQTKHAPGNARDATSRKLFLAHKNAEGTLTSSTPNERSRGTGILLGRDKFRRVQVRSAMRRVSRDKFPWITAAFVLTFVAVLAVVWFNSGMR